MIIKKFIANTEEEAIALMEKELGKDAIVLTKKTVKGTGLSALLSTERIEITAGMETKEVHNVATSDKVTFSKEALAAQKKVAPPLAHSFADVGKKLVSHFGENAPQPVAPTKEAPPQEGLRELIRQELLKAQASVLPSTVENPARQEVERSLTSPFDIDISGFLIDKGVSPRIARTLEEALVDEYGKTPFSSKVEERRTLLNALKALLAEKISCTGPLPLTARTVTTAIFLGPSGSGKTTACKKLAFQYAKDLKKNVALFAFDTRKQAGSLRSFSEETSIPLTVGESFEDLDAAQSASKSKDLLCVDTESFAATDFEKMAQFVEKLNARKIITRYLVIPATTREADGLGWISQYKKMRLDGLIISKLDETFALGVLLNLCVRGRVPLSYLTENASKEQLRIADPHDVGREILMRYNEEAFVHLRKSCG